MNNKTVNIDVSIIYYWYDHLLLRKNGEAEIITQAIEEGDFETFISIYNKYQTNNEDLFFFPSTADIFYQEQLLGEIDILNPLGFSLITDSEFECG